MASSLLMCLSAFSVRPDYTGRPRQSQLDFQILPVTAAFFTSSIALVTSISRGQATVQL